MRPEGAAKVVTLRVSTAEDDERELSQFIEDLREAIGTTANPDKVYSLGAYYLIDGKTIREDGTNFLTGERPEPDPPAKETTKKAAAKKAAAKPKAPKTEPETRKGDDVKDLANKVSEGIQTGRKVTMRKGP